MRERVSIAILALILAATFLVSTNVSAKCAECADVSFIDVGTSEISADLANLGSGGYALPTHLGSTPILVTWYGTPVRGASVSIDFRKVGVTDSRGYYYATVSPGKHTVQASSRRIAPPASTDPCPNKGCLSGATQYTFGSSSGICKVPLTLNCNC